MLQSTELRAARNDISVFEMPAVDTDALLKEDLLNESNFRSSYRFAHTFDTDIDLRRDFAAETLPDGVKVWRTNIVSKGAYSINLLLKNFDLPEGGRLFVYSADGRQVLGAFDHRNNSPRKILPIRPVAGENIIVEYSEPASASFEGHFTITEVNHDYRNVFRSEPNSDRTADYACMPDVLCSPAADNDVIRSSVLLVIDGKFLCSGTLVNNTANDGTPYILTAAHCLNDSINYGIGKNEDFYIDRAGTVVAFFNYNRPVCNTRMKGSEEMTLAEAYPAAIVERRDLVLLEMRETPPAWFNAYYAGWNFDSFSIPAGPYMNIHHPDGAVAKYGYSTGSLTLVNYFTSFFASQSHWRLPSYSVGSTFAGSSGSPLFDSNNQIIGTLSGGQSYCSGTGPNGMYDYYTAIYKSRDSLNLKNALDPLGTSALKNQGYDPNAANPIIRINNALNYDAYTLNESQLNENDYVFAKNSFNKGEFAEEFQTTDSFLLYGAYLLIPTLSSNTIPTVEITVYSGTSQPDEVLATQYFTPNYTDYDTTSHSFVQKQKRFNSVPTETFVLFDTPVPTGGRFWISYKASGTNESEFHVYDVMPTGSNFPNFAWIKTGTTEWTKSDEYSTHIVTTSLAIHPAGIKTGPLTIIASPAKNSVKAVFDRANRLLTVVGDDFTPERAEIFSITGQLLEKLQFTSGETSVNLQPKQTGTVAIIKILGQKKSISVKILY